MSKNLSINDICKICKGTLLCGDGNIIANKFSIDTRTLEEGSIYIAIKGESSDGNKYVNEAFTKGALACIIDEDIDTKKYINNTIIKVENGIKALQDLAIYKRNLYNIPVVAVTGSVGKTSTKDIIASVLSQKFDVLKTEGNFNNHIGLPLTLLNLKNHTAVVVEMGMNHQGEISILSKIARPTIAVITNVGSSHIGNLGSRENILKAKLEILDGLQENGTLIINNDNDLLHNWNQSVNRNNICTYGIENTSDFVATNISEGNNFSSFIIDNNKIKVHVAGRHFIYNALSAYCVGKILQIEDDKIIKGISKFELTSKRMELKKTDTGMQVIADYYNASYESMKMALEVLSKSNAETKIAVLGDMLELGNFSEELHKKVGTCVKDNNIDILITVGKQAKYIAKQAKDLGLNDIYMCSNNQEAVEILSKKATPKSSILLKASHGMHFEEIDQSIK